MKEYEIIKDFIKENKYNYLLGIVSVLCVDILQLIFPKVMGYITDDLQLGNITYRSLIIYIAIVLGIYVGITVFRYLFRVYIFGCEKKIEYELHKKLFDHMLTLSTNFYNKNKTGDLMAHVTNDVNAVRMSMGTGVLLVTDTIFLIITILTIMLTTIDVRLTILSLIPFPIIAIAGIKFGNVVHRRFTDVQEAFSSLTDKVQEVFSGIRVVKAFVQEEAELDNFNRISKNAFEKNMKLAKLWAIANPFVQIIVIISMVVVIVYGGIMVIYGNISLGDFVAFSIYLEMLIWPLISFGWIVNLIQRGRASLIRINRILQHPVEIQDKNPRDISEIKGHITFKNVTFRYEGSSVNALEDISMDIYPGKTLAIVGGTGSGKSTIVNLLLRLFDIKQGEILIDGYPIHEVPIEILRKNIGYVPQDVFLFSTTIRENISFGAENATMDQIERAAKIAQVYDNIMDFPQGFETVVGERGVTLSGGQKQRISIARAIIKDPKILILDDALSAVDTQTEDKILRELKQIMKDRTSIIISHRISTVSHADEIIVLKEGKIIERGNHQTLLENKGFYSELYHKQLLEEEIRNA